MTNTSLVVSIFMARPGVGSLLVVHTAFSAKGRGRNRQGPSEVDAGSHPAVGVVILPAG